MKNLRKLLSYGILMAGIMFVVFAGIYIAKRTEAAELTAVDVHGQLSVSGTKIVDKNGNPFQLRGISTHGINWDVGYPYVNEAAFKQLRDEWGVNAVRLAMYTVEYNGYCQGGDRQQLKTIIDNGVGYAKNLGMYAIIDWHVLNDQNPLNHQEEAKEFFAEMSAKYKDYNNVLYEICNEPNNCSWDDIKSYANAVIPVIRANDPDAIIIVGTPTWSQLGMQGHTNEVADSPLTGYNNIVYTLHFYCAEWSHTQYLPAKVDYAVAKGIPVLVSEFGLSAADGNGSIDTQQAKNWFDKLDGYGIGYFCWSLSNKNETSALIANWCNKTSGWSDSELTDAGRFLKEQYLLRKENYDDASGQPGTEPGTQPDNTEVKAFVERLYGKVLGREADEGGLNSWTNALVSGSSSGVDAGYGFVFSDECRNRELDDYNYVEMLYNTFMNRASDEGGKAAWVSQLKAGVDREEVLRGFILSSEFSDICNNYGIKVGNIDNVPAFAGALSHYRNRNADLTKFVARCYTKALDREYETDGLEAWCREIITGNTTPKQAAKSFIFSDEFVRKGLDNTEYVKVLYRTFMGREADEGGLNAWVTVLDLGKEDRAKVLEGFADSAEFAVILSGFGL